MLVGYNYRFAFRQCTVVTLFKYSRQMYVLILYDMAFLLNLICPDEAKLATVTICTAALHVD